MKKALLIGINYIGTKHELGGCINDIKNIEKFIIENCDYKIENIKKLTDETEIKPSRKNIEESILLLAKDVSAGDTLFFYYSGHGTQINSDEHNLDDVLVPLDYTKNGFIRDTWLYDNLANILPKGVTLWSFADCCHSGTILNLEYNVIYQRQKNNGKTEYDEKDWVDQYILYLVKDTLRKIETEADVYMFSGCLESQTSADTGEQGAFTGCFLETINHNYSDRKIIDILKEIDCRLNINGFEQVTQLSIGNLDDIHKNLDL
jgi:metacaspase-1